MRYKHIVFFITVLSVIAIINYRSVHRVAPVGKISAPYSENNVRQILNPNELSARTHEPRSVRWMRRKEGMKVRKTSLKVSFDDFSRNSKLETRNSKFTKLYTQGKMFSRGKKEAF